MTLSLLTRERIEFHRGLIISKVLTFSAAPEEVVRKFEIARVASNADTGQRASIRIANELADAIAENTGMAISNVVKKTVGQTLGDEFEKSCVRFLEATFPHLNHLRPGDWAIKKVGTRSMAVLGSFEQYSHLAELDRLANQYDELRTFLGEGYTISPDVVITRAPEPDSTINQVENIVDEFSSLRASLRAVNHVNVKLILHASLSCKFTMRSDRSQNSRTEALNLLRSRKGRAPHIAVITAEPTPTRIASLALGTGDVDCVYHFALYELRAALEKINDESALDLLDVMIDGKRLKDISDLPLDLAI